jgi:hypothetical protein
MAGALDVCQWHRLQPVRFSSFPERRLRNSVGQAFRPDSRSNEARQSWVRNSPKHFFTFLSFSAPVSLNFSNVIQKVQIQTDSCTARASYPLARCCRGDASARPSPGGAPKSCVGQAFRPDSRSNEARQSWVRNSPKHFFSFSSLPPAFTLNFSLRDTLCGIPRFLRDE